MLGKTPSLIVAALVLLAAGVAAANHPLLNGPSPGLAVDGSPSSTTNPPGATTPGPSTGTPGTVTSPNGTGGPAPAPPAGPGATVVGAMVIDQVVSITRAVEVGAPVSVFTVPAGQRLVLTDVLITNPGPTTACGAAVGPAGTAAPAPPAAGGAPASTESGTGVLCVPGQTSLSLGLTTGLEFAAGQSVQLANAAQPATTPPATGGPLHYHLRGFLMTPTGA